MALIRAGNAVRPALEQEVCPGLHDPTYEIKDDCAEGVARDKLAAPEPTRVPPTVRIADLSDPHSQN